MGSGFSFQGSGFRVQGSGRPGGGVVLGELLAEQHLVDFAWYLGV